MKRIFPLLILIFISCSIQTYELEEGFTCPEVMTVPQSVIGTPENPFQGDILINPTKQAGVTTALWEDKIVPIHFDSRWSEDQKNHIRAALLEYVLLGFSFPEISFEEAFSANPPDFVYIKFSGIAASHIGKAGGEQQMYLPSKHLTIETTIHEFGHAVGLHHPHVTEMQDEWLTIYWDNITDDAKFFFRTYKEYRENEGNQTEGFEYGDEYDIYSIMNYPSNAYAIDVTKPTMTLKDGTWFERGETLSEGDKLSINRMYECYKNRKL